MLAANVPSPAARRGSLPTLPRRVELENVQAVRDIRIDESILGSVAKRIDVGSRVCQCVSWETLLCNPQW